MGSINADSEEQLRARITQHLSHHGVTRPNDTLVDYLVAVGTGRQESVPL